MAKEQEDNQSRNNCMNGRSSSKKSKQKKVPQRGLGVAQLEKILEEQHMKDGVVNLPSQNSISSSSTSISSPTISSFLPLPINNFNHSTSSSSTSISNYLPLPVNNFNPMNQNSSTTLLPCVPSLGEFRSSMSLQQHMDGKVPSTVSLNKNNGVFEAGNWSNVPVPKLWNTHHELDFEKENFGIEKGLPFLPSLPFESNPIWPVPNWVQRTPQFHHQPSPQVVNNSSGNSSTSVPHLSTEPPSNQNSSSNMLAARPTEKMMTDVKRSYPFSLEFSQAPALNYIMPPYAEISTNPRTSCESESGFHFDAANSTSRESQSCSASNSYPNSKKRNKGIKDLDGNFLTLATPSPISCPPSQLNSSKPLAFNNQECPELESPHQVKEKTEDQHPTPQGYRVFKQQKQPLYSFIPAAKETQIGQTTSRIQNGHEVGEIIDLNLKL
ncbi:uncharacterized protein [Cicer arietinum]|nr:uncharacterized protein LOC101504963 isoform X2 [Cicer arietinum]